MTLPFPKHDAVLRSTLARNSLLLDLSPVTDQNNFGLVEQLGNNMFVGPDHRHLSRTWIGREKLHAASRIVQDFET